MLISESDGAETLLEHGPGTEPEHHARHLDTQKLLWSRWFFITSHEDEACSLHRPDIGGVNDSAQDSPEPGLLLRFLNRLSESGSEEDGPDVSLELHHLKPQKNRIH